MISVKQFQSGACDNQISVKFAIKPSVLVPPILVTNCEVPILARVVKEEEWTKTVREQRKNSELSEEPVHNRGVHCGS